MARIVDHGDGTFHIEEGDPVQDWRQATENPPPLPHRVVPNVSPGYELKNRFEQNPAFSEYAKDMVWQTPLKLSVQPSYRQAERGYAGQYNGDWANNTGNIEVFAYPNRNLAYGLDYYLENPVPPALNSTSARAQKRSDEIFQHELGHKWYYEALPETTRQEWGEAWPTSSIYSFTPEQLDEMRRDYPADYHQLAIESYANVPELRVNDYPAALKQRFYPGFFEGTMPIAPSPWTPDASGMWG